MITAEEFAAGYAERSGVSVEWLRKQGRVPMPCRCEEPECEGWQMGRIANQVACCGVNRGLPHEPWCVRVGEHD